MKPIFRHAPRTLLILQPPHHSLCSPCSTSAHLGLASSIPSSAPIQSRVVVLREGWSDLPIHDSHSSDTPDKLKRRVGTSPSPCDLVAGVEDVKSGLAEAGGDVPEEGDEDGFAGNGDCVELSGG